MLLMLIAFACVGDSRGVEVQVELQGPTQPPIVANARMFDTDLGFRVTLTRGFLVVAAVELLACETDEQASLWQKLQWTGKAHAHSPGSPTRLGVPAALSLLSVSVWPVGSLAPPPQNFCRTMVEVGVADTDAQYLPADLNLVGKSLYLEGSFAGPGMAGPRPFVVSATLGSKATVDHEPLTLSEQSQTTLHVEPEMERWFDGIDFGTAPTDVIARRVLEHARTSLKVTFQ